MRTPGSLSHRQGNNERGSSTGDALRCDGSAVPLHDLSADGQTYACSIIWASSAMEPLEGLEDTVKIFFIEPNPVVLHTNLDPRAVRGSLFSRRRLHFFPGDFDKGPLLPMKLQAIAQEVLEELSHLLRARLDNRQFSYLDPGAGPFDGDGQV